jgi:threonine dehydratase
MTNPQPTPHEIAAASEAIAPLVHEHAAITPLLEFAGIGKEVGSAIYGKAENLQHTGSFKLRGALSKLSRLSTAQRDRGVVTSSTGNH